MKRLLLSAIAAITLFSTGCKEEFDVAAPYKDITFVYAMLDMDSLVNYVRIQKAFLSQDLSAIDMAQVSDSSFYPDGALDVQIRELSSNGTILNSVALTKTQILAKEDGEFFTTPNYAYKYDRTSIGKLSKNNIYRLVIKNNITGETDSSQTYVVNSDTAKSTPAGGNFYIYSLRYDYPPDINQSHEAIPLNFARMRAQSTKTEIQFVSPANATVAEGFIRFYYWEKDSDQGTEVQKYFDYPLERTRITTNVSVLSFFNYQMYDFFASKLGTAPANIQRFMDSCELFFYAGTEDYFNYSTITQLQGNSGLTSNEIKPLYTNLKGKDVYGLFTSRAFRWGKALPIDAETLDSLSTNPLTQPTHIQKQRSDK
jgi:hypothetical protein